MIKSPFFCIKSPLLPVDLFPLPEYVISILTNFCSIFHQITGKYHKYFTVTQYPREFKYRTFKYRHGVKQPRNPWSDVPVYITQCPIMPGNKFTYTIDLSIEEGTLWWHAHNNFQRVTVNGAIVIYPRPGTAYPYWTPDDEHIIILVWV